MNDNITLITESLKKELRNDAREFKLSGVDLVNHFYENYTDKDQKTQYVQQFDRHDANQKSNDNLIDWLGTHRYAIVSDKTMEEFGLHRAPIVSQAINAMKEAQETGYAEFDGKGLITKDILLKVAEQDNRPDMREIIGRSGAPLWQQDEKRKTLSPVFELNDIIKNIPQREITGVKYIDHER